MDGFDFLPDNLKENPMDYLKPENLRESIRELEAEIRWDPLNAKYHFDLGVFLDCAKESEGAVRAYVKALELNPGMKQAHYLLGEHFFWKKRYWDAAMEFGQYVSVEPDDPDGTLYLKFGIACLRLGCTADARRQLEKARIDKNGGRARLANKLLSRLS